MEGKFELLLESPGHYSTSIRTRVNDILRTRCGISSTAAEQFFNGAPPHITVMRSDDKQHLEVVCNEITAVGGKVLIVRSSPQTETRPAINFHEFYRTYTDRLTKVLSLLEVETVQALVNDLLEARKQNRQIFIFGNGGSAANASHWANDLTKQRFDDEDRLFRVMSLTDNLPWITATANDFGYEAIFTHQLKNLLQPEDLVVAITSSGNSANIVQALEYANQKGARTYAVVGFTGGQSVEVAQKSIYIPTKVGEYCYMEDVCSIIGHMITLYLEMHDRQDEKASQPGNSEK